jgi:hypothetical protein
MITAATPIVMPRCQPDCSLLAAMPASAIQRLARAHRRVPTISLSASGITPRASRDVGLVRDQHHGPALA